MSYTVSGIKDFLGRNGHGFNAFLHHNGRKIAFVTDHANGGCLSFDWLAKTREEVEADAAALDAHCAAQPHIDLSGMKVNCAGAMVPVDRDWFVTELVEAEERRRAMKSTLKRLLTKRVLFDVDGVMKQTPVQPAITDAYVEAVAKRYPNAPILNRLPFDEALALYMARCA